MAGNCDEHSIGLIWWPPARVRVEVVGVVMVLWRRTVCLTGCGSIWAAFTTCSSLRFSCANTTSRMYFSTPRPAATRTLPHPEDSWNIWDVNQRAVSGWLCKSVCGCLSLYCYDGTEVFKKNRRCECTWDVPEDRFIAQRLAFSADMDGSFMEIQLLIQGSALSQMFFL